jgi:hypothetical protein
VHPVDVLGLDPGVYVTLAQPYDHRLAGHPLDVANSRMQIGDQYGLGGARIEAVSAMKCTPQNTITCASVAAAQRESSGESLAKSARSWISGTW